MFFVLFLLFVFGENYANQSLSLPSESKSVPKIKVALSMCNQACRAYKNLPSLWFLLLVETETTIGKACLWLSLK